MAKKSGKGVLSTPMQRAPWQSISLHGNTSSKTDMNVANGITQAPMVPLKGKPAGVDSPMGTFPNRKK